MTLRYAWLAFIRRFIASRPLRASLTLTCFATFAAITLDRLATYQLSAVIGPSEGRSELWLATDFLFSVAIVIATLLSQLLLSRILISRRSELLLLCALGVSRSAVAITAAAEHALHVLVGVAVGCFMGLAVSVVAYVLDGVPVRALWPKVPAGAAIALGLPLLSTLAVSVTLVFFVTTRRAAALSVNKP